MNLKALITTLVLGSSTMASADSVSLSGSVSVSLGGSAHARPAPAPAPAPVIVRDHRVVEQDPCDTHPAPAPVVVQPPAPRPVVYPPAPAPIVVRPPQPMPPAWSNATWQPSNLRLTGDASFYIGTMGYSSIRTRPSMWQQRYQTKTQAWFEMTQATRIENNRLFLDVNDNGFYRALKIESLGRGSDITKVRIDFKDRLANKSHQIVNLNQHLSGSHSSLTIDLDGNYRQISRIVVYGKTNRGSAIKLLAM